MVSNRRLVLADFGSALTASHASTSLSDTESITGTISGEGMTATLVRSTLGTAGIASSTPLSVVGLLALDTKAGVCVSWDGLE